MTFPAALALLGSLMAVDAGSDPAAPPPRVGDVFLLTGRFLLETDGTTDGSARIYTKSGQPGFLVECATLSAPVMLDPGEQAVKPLDTTMVIPVGEEGRRVLAGGLGSRVVADLVPDGPTAGFAVEGHAYRLVPAPHVLGITTLDALLEGSPEYRRTATEYQPSPEGLEVLHTTRVPVRIDVFFGSWCGFCSSYMPRLLRVLDETRNPSIEVVFHGVPRKITLDPDAAALGVRSVPTGVVVSRGREVGRLEGDQWHQPEVALAALLGTLR